HTQSILLAMPMALTWCLFAAAAKWAVSTLPERPRRVMNWLVATIGLVGAALFLTGLVITYGLELNLNNLPTSSVLVRGKALPFIGQLLGEFAISFGLLSALLSLLDYGPHVIENPDHARLSGRISELNKQLKLLEDEVGKADGNLKEYNASRESFVGEGLLILQ